MEFPNGSFILIFNTKSTQQSSALSKMMKKSTPYAGESLLKCIKRYAIRDQPDNLCDFMNEFMVDLTDFWRRHEGEDAEDIIYLFQNQGVPSERDQELQSTSEEGEAEVSPTSSEREREIVRPWRRQRETERHWFRGHIQPRVIPVPAPRVMEDESGSEWESTEEESVVLIGTSESVSELAALAESPGGLPPPESLASMGLCVVQKDTSGPYLAPTCQTTAPPTPDEEDNLDERLLAAWETMTERGEHSLIDSPKRFARRCFACLFEVARAQCNLPPHVLIDRITHLTKLATPVVRRVLIYKQVCLVPLSPCHAHRSLQLRPVNWTSDNTEGTHNMPHLGHNHA